MTIDEAIAAKEPEIHVHSSEEFSAVCNRKDIRISAVRLPKQKEYSLWVFIVSYPEAEQSKFDL